MKISLEQCKSSQNSYWLHVDGRERGLVVNTTVGNYWWLCYGKDFILLGQDLPTATTAIEQYFTIGLEN